MGERNRPARKKRTLRASWIAPAVMLVVVVAAMQATSIVGAQEPAPTIIEREKAALNETPGKSPPITGEAPVPTRNMLTVIRDGGPVMIPIIFCSLLLFVFILERSIALRRSRVIPRPFVKRFLQQLKEGQIDRDGALKLCAENRSPVSDVFAAAVKKWNKTSVEVEQAIIDAGERVTNNLRRNVRMFNGLYTVAPLLGLLGTVSGMISSFNDIYTTDAMGRPELLAVGISHALLATAGGLMVAIPALIAYMFFVGRVDQLVMQLDSLGQEVVQAIASDAVRIPIAKTIRRDKDKEKEKSAA